MNLYLISQKTKNGYDTYDSAVVAAKNEDAARNIHPSGDPESFDTLYSWCDPNKVTVELIGRAVRGATAGVVCASFNAG